MVSIINTRKSISRTLNYNEKKVQRGVATLIDASGFLKKQGDLTFHDKLERFRDLQELNTRSKTNVIHVTLNFDPSENLSHDLLKKIAEEYMEGIGFGDQPYLVYEHRDSGHQHVHIVSTLIFPNGKRFKTQNIGKRLSAKIRKALEQKYSLVQAGGKKQKAATRLTPVGRQKIEYGKSESRQSIANVLNGFVDTYNYTSLEELNAALRLYNVEADRGKEGSRTYQRDGLKYQILGENGKKIGKAVKASAFFEKPTLKKLRERIAANKATREPVRNLLKKSIDQAYAKFPHMGINQLAKELQKSEIDTVLHQNKEKFVYGITFVDHKNHSIFKGSDLGKLYSLAALQKRAFLQTKPQPSKEAPIVKETPAQTAHRLKNQPVNLPIARPVRPSQPGHKAILTHQTPPSFTPSPKLLETLLPDHPEMNPVPRELTAKKKKKRRRHIE